MSIYFKRCYNKHLGEVKTENFYSLIITVRVVPYAQYIRFGFRIIFTLEGKAAIFAETRNLVFHELPPYHFGTVPVPSLGGL